MQRTQKYKRWGVLGALRYQYPGAASINSTEAYVAASYGEVTGKYSHTVSRKYFGLEDGRGTGYVNLAWNHLLKETLIFHAAVGHTLLPTTLRCGPQIRTLNLADADR